MRRARSIQILKKIDKLTLEEIAEEYFHWLPSILFGLIRVKKNDGLRDVEIRFFELPLLKLRRFTEKGSIEFEVVGGLLSRGEGIFSFSFKDELLVISLAHFLPRLPWPIYRLTQYPFHELVMFLFLEHLYESTNRNI